jgi:Arc/MetJ-type ribon-helix-helix transcriptional regulator
VELSLSPAQEAFVRDAIASGRLHDEKDAVQQALTLWEERERRRREILSGVDAAERAPTEGRAITPEAMEQLAKK